MSQPRMRRYNRAKEDVFIPFWVPGWNLLYTVVGIAVTMGFLGFQVGLPSLFGLVGIVVAPLLWFASTRYIEGRYEPIIEGFLADAPELAAEVLDNVDSAVESYTLQREWDTRLRLSPKAHYRSTTLFLEESIVVPFETTLHTSLLDLEFPTEPPEIEYGSIVDVYYDEGDLVIETETEGRFSFEADDRPRAAIDALRERIESDDSD